MNIKLFIKTTALCLLAFSLSAQKKVTIYRSGVALSPSYTTLDSAFKKVLSGDSIVLSPHTFYEHNLSLRDATNIILQGTLGSSDTSTIDGSSSGPILEMRTSSRVRDIIFQHSKGRALTPLITYPWDTFYISGHCIFRNNNGNRNQTILGFPWTGCLTLEDDVLIENNTNAQYTVYSEYHLRIKDRVQIRHNQSLIATIINQAQGFRIEGQARIQDNRADTGRTAGILMGAGTPDSTISFIGDNVVISNNKVSTAEKGTGGAICILRKPSRSSPVRLEIGAAQISNNRAARGGAIYCERQEYTIISNGTRFTGNTAHTGGAIYANCHINIRNADFVGNKADTGAALYLAPEVSSHISPVVSVTRSRIYDFTGPGKRPNEVFATYTPTTALPPLLSVGGNWWGNSDTLNAFRCVPPFATLSSWAVTDWQVNGGMAPAAGDTVFPVGATIRTRTGAAFPASSFGMLQGHFSADTGSFSSTTVPINSDNELISRYRVFPDSALTSADVHFLAYIDEDTFRATVVVWSRDTTTDPVTLRATAPPAPLLVYPNPVSDRLQISNLPAGSILTLSDASGRVIWRRQATMPAENYPLADLAPGIYLLEVRTKDGYRSTIPVRKA